MTSSAQLQREADAARVGLADTLGQLRDGVAPSALSGEAIALVKDSGLSILKSLADSARANPVPALLIGAGLTMLLTRTTGSDVMGVATSTLKSAAATGADAARSAASGVAGAASSAASSVAGAAKEAVKDKELTPVMLANLHEVMNICTRLMLRDDSPHLKLCELCPLNALPPTAAAIIAAPKGRIDFEIGLGKYGSGVLSVMCL